MGTTKRHLITTSLLAALMLLTLGCSKNALVAGGGGSGDNNGSQQNDENKGSTSEDRSGDILTEEFKVAGIKRQHDFLILSSLAGTEPESARLFPLMTKLPQALPAEGYDYRFLYAGLMPLAADLTNRYQQSEDVTKLIAAEEPDLLNTLSKGLPKDPAFLLRSGATLHVIIVAAGDRTPDKIDDKDGIITPIYLDVTIPSEIVIHGLIPQQGNPACAYQPANEYLKYAIGRRGQRFDLCRDDWQTFATGLANRLSDQGKLFSLKLAPDLSQEVVVSVNDTELKDDEFKVDELSWQLTLMNNTKEGDVVKITYVSK